MKLQVHVTHRDEESGQFWREFLGRIEVPDGTDLGAQQWSLREAADKKFPVSLPDREDPYSSLHIAPTGQRVRLRGKCGAGNMRRMWADRREQERREEGT